MVKKFPISGIDSFVTHMFLSKSSKRLEIGEVDCLTLNYYLTFPKTSIGRLHGLLWAQQPVTLTRAHGLIDHDAQARTMPVHKINVKPILGPARSD